MAYQTIQGKKTRLLQISDTHLLSTQGAKLFDIDTAKHLESVVTHVLQHEKACDTVILSGDLSEDGKTPSYKKLVEIISLLPFPVYWIAGNHDCLETMRLILKNAPFQSERYFELNSWRIILANSVLHGKAYGYLSNEELTLLNSQLEIYPQPTVIVLHHHPVKVGNTVSDSVWLSNAESFWSIVRKHPQVKLVLSGHVHHVYEETIDTVHFATCPSTAMQLLPGASSVIFDDKPPGYRWIDLYENGEYETGVTRVKII